MIDSGWIPWNQPLYIRGSRIFLTYSSLKGWSLKFLLNFNGPLVLNTPARRSWNSGSSYFWNNYEQDPTRNVFLKKIVVQPRLSFRFLLLFGNVRGRLNERLRDKCLFEGLGGGAGSKRSSHREISTLNSEFLLKIKLPFFSLFFH